MDEGFSGQSFINEIPWVCLLYTTPPAPIPERMELLQQSFLDTQFTWGRRLINCVPITPMFTPTELWANIRFRYPWHAQSPSDSQCIIGHVQNNYIEQSINLLHLKVDWFSQGTLLVCQELVLVPGIGKLFCSSASSKHAFTPHFFNSYLFKVKLANYFAKSWMN